MDDHVMELLGEMKEIVMNDGKREGN